jgi:hypothetical protein
MDINLDNLNKYNIYDTSCNIYNLISFIQSHRGGSESNADLVFIKNNIRIHSLQFKNENPTIYDIKEVLNDIKTRFSPRFFSILEFISGPLDIIHISHCNMLLLNKLFKNIKLNQLYIPATIDEFEKYKEFKKLIKKKKEFRYKAIIVHRNSNNIIQYYLIDDISNSRFSSKYRVKLNISDEIAIAYFKCYASINHLLSIAHTKAISDI